VLSWETSLRGEGSSTLVGGPPIYTKIAYYQDIFLNHDYIPFTPSWKPATLGARGGHVVDVKQVVGRNIRAACKAKGLSQFQLAERSGLSADFIGKVERGTTSPSIESLKAIAEALNFSLRDLFEGEAEAGPSQEALIELIRSHFKTLRNVRRAQAI
jgi:transcriptional regulator with XRE-family HTH domain